MQQFPPVNEVRPYGVVDLTDQSTMLLVLEELGIAHLQDEWLRTHTPEAPDAAQAAEQHKEFFEDLCAILRITRSLLRPSGLSRLRFRGSRFIRKKSKRKAPRQIPLNTFSS